MTTEKVTLITYNIHKGFGLGKVRFLLPQMKHAISELNPDFLFLQEVQGAHRRHERRIHTWPSMPQVEFLAEKIWPHYVYSKNAVYHSGHHGNAILSKIPFETSESINLSHHHRASRGILHSKLYLDTDKTKPLHLLCVHLGLLKNERSMQTKMLMKRISEAIPAHEPLLMGGDFNDWRMRVSKPLFEELGILEAFFSKEGRHARSFPAIRPALCVDRVYFRGMEVTEVRCLQGKPWRMLSDHVPLYVQFQMT